MLDGVAATLEALQQERPRFHGAAAAPPVNLRLRQDALALVAERLAPGMRTLETGSGYSTTLFAAAGVEHTAISPLAEEHARIAEWVERRGVSAARVRFVVGASQSILPSFEPGPLDLALIDGDHAFPAPLIDWYYLAEHVQVGGWVIVDDTNIVTGALLRDFLAAESARWRLVADLEKTSAFEKVAAPSVQGIGWQEQPFCASKLRYPRLERLLARSASYLLRRRWPRRS